MFIIYFLVFWLTLLLIYIILSIVSNKKGKKEILRCESFQSTFKKEFSFRKEFAIETTIAGVKHENREKTIIRGIRNKSIQTGEKLYLVPDTMNKYDKTATIVCTKKGHNIGYLPNKYWSDQIYNDLMEGKKWEATIKAVLLPSEEFNNYNLLIELWEFTNQPQ